jgi:hypothetical protein
MAKAERATGRTENFMILFRGRTCALASRAMSRSVFSTLTRLSTRDSTTAEA